jgi:hypothetical protein
MTTLYDVIGTRPFTRSISLSNGLPHGVHTQRPETIPASNATGGLAGRYRFPPLRSSRNFPIARLINSATAPETGRQQGILADGSIVSI